MEKITATTKKGLPIISLFISKNEGGTFDSSEIICKIQTELTKNSSRQAFLVKWVNDGRYIRINDEPFALTPGSVY